jgi:hypothetical protein
MLLKQSTVRNVAFFLVDATDHVSPITGLTPTVVISKDGAAFAAAAGAVTEIGNGWYAIALTAADTDTLGDLAVHVTATGADDTDFVRQVVVELPGALSTTERSAVADAVLTRETSNIEVTVKSAPKCLGALVIEGTHKWKDDGAGNLKFADSADDYAGANALSRSIVATDSALVPLKEVGSPA